MKERDTELERMQRELDRVKKSEKNLLQKEELYFQKLEDTMNEILSTVSRKCETTNKPVQTDFSTCTENREVHCVIGDLPDDVMNISQGNCFPLHNRNNRHPHEFNNALNGFGNQVQPNQQTHYMTAHRRPTLNGSGLMLGDNIRSQVESYQAMQNQYPTGTLCGVCYHAEQI